MQLLYPCCYNSTHIRPPPALVVTTLLEEVVVHCMMKCGKMVSLRVTQNMLWISAGATTR